MKYGGLLLAAMILISIPAAVANGQPAPVDQKWGTRGVASVTFGNVAGSFPTVSTDSRGRVYAGIGSRLARFDATGRLDRTWGGDGVIEIFNGGSVFTVGSRPFVLEGSKIRRLTERGGTDTTFGVRGELQLDYEQPSGSWNRKALVPGCRLLTTSSGIEVSSQVTWRPPGADFNSDRHELVAHRISYAALAGVRPSVTTSVVVGTGECLRSTWSTDGTVAWRAAPTTLELFGSGGSIAIGTDGSGVPHEFGDTARLRAHGDGVLVIGRRAPGEEWRVTKILESGLVDTSFAQGGTATLRGSSSPGTQLLDARVSRGVTSIVVQNLSLARISVHRFDARGRALAGFGTQGVLDLVTPGARDANFVPTAVFDSADRTVIAWPIDTLGANGGKGVAVRRYATNASDIRVRTVAKGRRVTVTTSNAGPRSARRVQTIVTIPAGMSVRRSAISIGSCRVIAVRRTTRVVCLTPLLAVGASATVTVDVVGAGTATVASSSTNPDHNVRNNRAAVRAS